MDPVRVWLVSDLHLEDGGPGPWDPAVEPEFDLLACAGDTVQSDPAACVEAAARLARGRPCVLVLGNHDVWGRDPGEAVAEARGRHPGVQVLDGDSAEACGLRIAGGTLWDDPDGWPAGIPRIGAAEGRGPGDPSGEPIMRRDGGALRRITLGEIAAEHARTRDAIAAARPDVVLTHYPPSEADLASVASPSCWLHGHRHSVLVEARGRHRLVRMPRDRRIWLVGAVLDVLPGGVIRGVRPVVSRGAS